MLQPVESGKFLDFLKKLVQSVEKAFKDLASLEIVEKTTDPKDNSFTYTIETASEDHKFKVKCIPESDSGEYFTIQAISTKEEKKPPLELKGVRFNNIVKNCMKIAEKWFGEDSLGSMQTETGQDILNESKSLNVSLKYVKGSSDSRLDLVKVTANYNASDALVDLDTVLSDDSFMDSLSDDTVTLEISPVDDGYEVETVQWDVTNVSEYLEQFLCVLHNIQWALYTYKYSTKCSSGYSSMSYLVDIDYRISDYIRIWSELVVEYGYMLPHPYSYVYPECKVVYASTADIKKSLKEYRDILKLYYWNFTQDVRSIIIDTQVRDLNHLVDYMLPC